MKNVLTLTPWIIILILLVYIKQCTTTGTHTPEIIYKDSIQIRDSISPPIYVTGPTVFTPVPYEVIVYDTLTQDTTTNEHLSYLDWLSLKKYNLAISDTNQNLNINVEIQYNRIKKWDYSGTYFEKYKIKTITKIEIPKPKPALYIGFILTANKNNYLGISPSVFYKTKKNTSFLAGYDIINNNISAGILIKLGK